MRSPLLLPLLLLLSCDNDKGSGHTGGVDDTGETGLVDNDRDGYTSDEDCDDNDAGTNPGVDEECDGLDNNCNDLIDEDAQSTWYPDEDGDGFGDEAGAYLSCGGDGGVGVGGDCDDGDSFVYPDAEEICDGIDNNCDGATDEGTGTGTIYADTDGDGFGDPESAKSACTLEEGYVADGTDCDDADAYTYPGAEEVCDGIDNDCDDLIDDDATDATTWYNDADSDLYGDDTVSETSCEAPDGYVDVGGDCDETNPEVNPGTAEQCDGLDNDCDGTVDEDIVYTWYTDADGDAHGDPDAVLDTCDPPEGSSATGDDCDDAVDTTYPGADELCNGVDDDCDGTIDDDPVDTSTWYSDADGDGYGDPGTGVSGCEAPGDGYVTDGTDCDDTDATVHPDATELCDGLDNDCDGSADEDGDGGTSWYDDADGDGYGDPATEVSGCESPGDTWVTDGSDCDDTDASFNPSADEVCDTLDNDCDGSVDEDPVDGDTWYYDDDEDGYGDATTTSAACEQPDGFVATSGDCDDLDDTVYPGAEEACDGVDNDCDGTIDDGATGSGTWYSDEDSDGYGDDAVTSDACAAPDGYVAYGGDCDDSDPAYNPGALEDDCSDSNDYNCDGSTGYADDDGDGFAACEECDDTDGAVHPDASEVCDGVDNDCDGTIDGTDAADLGTWYADADEDGYGDPDTSIESCEAPTGYVSDNTDCDDAQASVSPGDAETCDGLDNDCDGAIDEDGASGELTWYADDDSDGFGDASSTTSACTAPTGYTDDDTDCDDSAATTNPDADELCSDGEDNDCDGSTDESDAIDATTWYEDADGDFFGDDDVSTRSCSRPRGYRPKGGDCDDSDDTIYPRAPELCDELDNDCDGSVDEGVTDASTYYADTDGDGYGDPDSTSTGCSAPSGYVSDDTDCEDGEADINPGETELCNGVDDDCDGTIDGPEASDAASWYADLDEDGFGDPDNETADCDAPSGYLSDDGDCDDLNGDINPDATEVCDGVDNDCDGSADETGATGGTDWYQDGDDDGYGDSDVSTTACDAPSGYTDLGGDCDDSDPDYNPGASESCTDRVDYNCDGSVGYTDSDGDDVAACLDCDDDDDSSYPGATEVCDGADNDCDGTIDESGATGEATWYRDSDGDGYGDASSSVKACDRPSGYVSDKTDCDDGDADIHPGALELCDDVDNDCDGSTDEDAADTSTWYRDGDRDGFGDADTSTTACDRPSGYVSDDTDCDDSASSVNPDADEVCNDVDDDCDGSVDEGASDASTWYRDADRDGFGDETTTSSACDRPSGYTDDSADCDDGDGDVNPDADEVCDDVDNDCDGEVDEDDAIDADTWYYDDDGDGYGDEGVSTRACDLPADYSSLSTDCDDADSGVHPGATDVCDGVDNDCSGYVDDGSSCDGGCEVEYYGDNTYLFCGTARSWTAGQTWCSSLGYHMLDISDSAENIWAVDTANTYSTAKWWIGFNDRTTEGSFVWESGASVTYTNWHSGEPNDSGGEDCTQLNRFSDYTWNDEPCASSFRFVCEL